MREDSERWGYTADREVVERQFKSSPFVVVLEVTAATGKRKARKRLQVLDEETPLLDLEARLDAEGAVAGGTELDRDEGRKKDWMSLAKRL